MENVLVLCQQRTGSNLLCYALSFFKNYRNVNEFYNASHLNPIMFTEEERYEIFKAYDCESPPDERLLFNRINREPAKAIDVLRSLTGENLVFKITQYSFSYNYHLYSLIKEFDKFILLDRSNTLEQYVSKQIAEETNFWHQVNTNNHRIELDVEEYKKFCENKKIFYDDMKSRLRDKDHIVLNYEKDLMNGITDSLLNNLQSFLSGSPEFEDKDRINPIRRQNTANIVTKISNWDEVKYLI